MSYARDRDSDERSGEFHAEAGWMRRYDDAKAREAAGSRKSDPCVQKVRVVYI